MTTPSSDLFAHFSSLADRVFSFSIAEYLNARGDRSLYGYETDLAQRKYRPLFGDPPSILTDEMNARFIDAKAGYRTNVSSVFPLSGVNADILLLSTDLMSTSGQDLDSILVHELCHLLIDENLQAQIQCLLDDKAKYYGERLYKKTDLENEHITRHTQEFCTLLAAASQRYATTSNSPNDRWAVINSAMRYDLRSNART